MLQTLFKIYLTVYHYLRHLPATNDLPVGLVSRESCIINSNRKLTINVALLLVIYYRSEIIDVYSDENEYQDRTRWNRWRVRTCRSYEFNRSGKRVGSFRVGFRFLRVSASTLLFSNIWQLFGNLSKRRRTMVHSKFRAKGMPNGLSFVSLPYKRCSLKYSSLIFFITISYCHYSSLPRVTNLFKEN